MPIQAIQIDQTPNSILLKLAAEEKERQQTQYALMLKQKEAIDNTFNGAQTEIIKAASMAPIATQRQILSEHMDILKNAMRKGASLSEARAISQYAINHAYEQSMGQKAFNETGAKIAASYKEQGYDENNINALVSKIAIIPQEEINPLTGAKSLVVRAKDPNKIQSAIDAELNRNKAAYWNAVKGDEEVTKYINEAKPIVNSFRSSNDVTGKRTVTNDYDVNNYPWTKTVDTQIGGFPVTVARPDIQYATTSSGESLAVLGDKGYNAFMSNAKFKNQVDVAAINKINDANKEIDRLNKERSKNGEKPLDYIDPTDQVARTLYGKAYLAEKIISKFGTEDIVEVKKQGVDVPKPTVINLNNTPPTEATEHPLTRIEGIKRGDPKYIDRTFMGGVNPSTGKRVEWWDVTSQFQGLKLIKSKDEGGDVAPDQVLYNPKYNTYILKKDNEQVGFDGEKAKKAISETGMGDAATKASGYGPKVDAKKFKTSGTLADRMRANK